MSMMETVCAAHPREESACVTRVWRVARLVAHAVTGVFVAHVLLLGPNGPLPRAPVRQAQRAVVSWWVRRLYRILSLEVKVHGALPDRHSLLVTNHVSWLDIPALLSIVDADFVAKQDVQRWPLIGAIAARAGTIFLARGQRNAAKTTADHMTWRLAQQRHVILFPEATTTDGHSVRRFYARLYQAAIRTHSRVQAVAIRYPGLDGPQGVAPFIGDAEFVGHLWRLLAEKRIVVELHFCAPILADADRRTLADRTRRQVCEALGLASELRQPRSARFCFPRKRAA